MPLYRYTCWDGSQQVSPIGEEDLMEQLAEQMAAHGDVSVALRSLAQKGLRGEHGQNIPGIEQMLQRLRNMRKDALDRYALDHVLDNIRERLQDIVQTERDGLESRLAQARSRLDAAEDERSSAREPSAPTLQEMQSLLKSLEEMAGRNLEYLEGLPSQPAGALQQLKDYEFMDDAARDKFDELLRSLQQQVLDSSFRELSQRLGSIDSGQMAALKEMVRELNQLLEAHLEGGDAASRALFDRFMQKYGEQFGPNPPGSPDELVDSLLDQMAQLESLLGSLSPGVRNELEETLASAFRDDALQDEMALLASNLRDIRPDGLDNLFRFGGNEPLGLEEALEVMGQLQKLEELERQLRKAQQGHRLDSVSGELVRDVLGEETYQELEQLRRMTEALEAAGYINRVGGRYELTPKGVRKIGHKALQEIFTLIRKDRLGGHPTTSNGAGGEMLEETQKYQYGDPFNINLQRTLLNSVQRAAGTPVRISPEDFEVRRTEQSSHVATVLMLDLSLSMAMRGNFQAAKKVALALDNLIRSQFPGDSLHIVGFSTYAREVKAEKLAYLSWDDLDPYTNIQHGLNTARKLLDRTHGCTRQIIMVSDGEPTAHMEAGQLFLQYPPSPRTIRETLKEVKRCTRQDIKINTFMLERSPYLAEFVDQMTRINRGRVFYTSPDKLGEYILVDYLTSRRTFLA